MANEEHLKILKQGVEVWNKWRVENPNAKIDLEEANLEYAQLSMANFSKANLKKAKLFEAILVDANLKEADLSGANLTQTYIATADFSKTKLTGAALLNAYIFDAKFREADLRGATLAGAGFWGGVDLRGAKLRGASLYGAILIGADLREADLGEADLQYANLSEANLSKANLSEANLERSILVQTKLNRANLTGCKIFGISAWELELKKTIQSNLIITHGDPIITVDNLEVAQFIHLLLSRKKIRNIIDTITSKSVLILGRFTPDRKAILDAMANELRKHNLLPIIFDFERASSRDFTETIKTLAGMSLFVIADVTNPKSAPLELQATVPDYQIPFVPILEKGEPPFSMLSDLLKYPWVLPLLEYRSSTELIKTFKGAIVDEAFNLHKELIMQKAEKMKTRSTEDYLKKSD